MNKIIICLLICLMVYSWSGQAYAESNIDKTLHFSAGMAVASSANILKVENSSNYVFLAGASKELYDYYSGGSVEFEDIVATVVGGYVVNYLSSISKESEVFEFNINKKVTTVSINHQF
jgi:uncharacterized protein YfiM (DUF2279 family)